MNETSACRGLQLVGIAENDNLPRCADDLEADGAPALMTCGEVAAELRLSERTLRRLARQGKVGPAPISLGHSLRYRREEIGAWIRAGCPDLATWRAEHGGRKRS